MRQVPHIAAAFAGLALIAAAPAQNNLCDFAKKVVAEKDSDFALLKGQALNPEVFKNETFHGTLLPMRGADCTLDIRRTAGQKTIPPDYTCSLGKSKEFEAANRIFSRAALDMRACFPQVKFVVMYDGDGKDPYDSFDWIVAGDSPGYTLELEMTNGVDLIAQALTGGNTEPDIEISIRVTNTAELGQ